MYHSNNGFFISILVPSSSISSFTFDSRFALFAFVVCNCYRICYPLFRRPCQYA